ncbi:MAG TPA: alpha/beta hydrolase [Dermatophilaceae bacterium]|nr:alpha/beta hydrolase [Dermatophilaceae bacterium]
MAPRDTATGVGAAVGVAAAAVGAAATGAAVERAARLRARVPGPPRAELFEHLPGQELTVVTTDGVKLHVEVDDPRDATDPLGHSGADRPTVVLCHGFTLNLRAWVFQRRALTAAGYRVVTWDQRSHGRSGPAEAASCTIEQLGEDLAAVLAETCPSGPLALVGHSMGGMTLMSFAEQQPEVVRERVLAAAFVATSAGGEGLTSLGLGVLAGKVIGRVGPDLLGRLGRHQERLVRFRRFGRNLEDSLVERWSFDSPVSRDLVRFAGDMIFSTSLDVMGSFLPSLGTLDAAAALDNFSGIETLVINGEGDLLTPPNHSEAIVRLVPGAEHVVLTEAGHLIMLEHPDLVSEQLLLLVERGQRAHAGHTAVAAAPRVRRTVTDVRRRREVRAGLGTGA